jgi:hypothetical protein
LGSRSKGSNMKLIPLTQNQVAIVDDHWYEFLNQWKWHAIWNNHAQGYYATRHEGLRPNRKVVFMHRVVAKTPDGMLCDHIHQNTLDNREEELRNVTYSQSNMNRRTPKKNKFGITGISRYSEGSGYTATLYFEKKRVLYKAFPTLDEAIAARKEAEIKYFGQYAMEEK